MVVCNNLWEHVPDPVMLLNHIAALLKPGGHVVIATPSRYRLTNLIRALLGRPVALVSNHHVTEYTVGQVKEQLAFGGFAVRSVRSKPIPLGFLKDTARRVFGAAVKLLGSHHRLEATVFYLAQQRGSSA